MTSSRRTSPAADGHQLLLVGASLGLASVGAVILATTADTTWSVLLLLSAALAGLAAPPPTLARLLRWALPAMCAAGWAAGSLRDLVMAHPAGAGSLAGRTVLWAASGLALAASLVLAELSRSRHVHQRNETARALSHARDVAVADPLTGLANRHGVNLLGSQILQTARRRGDAVYCIALDVDGLAKVNRAVGRNGGDEVLLAVAEALRATSRATDVAARWGEDEFVLVGPGTGLAPLEVERRVRAHCLEHGYVDRRVWEHRVSAGSHLLEPWDDDVLDTVLHLAERDMRVRRALRRDDFTSDTVATIVPPPQPGPDVRPG